MAETIDLNGMSLKDLKKLRKDVDQAIASFEERQRQQALAELESKAKEMGFSLSELTGGKAKTKGRSVSAPKYRDPEDPDRTWTGRGRQPEWFKEALAKGKDPEEMLIR